MAFFNSAVGVLQTLVIALGTSPVNFSPGVFAMIRNVSESVIIPIAGLILTFIACYELIQLIIDHNNLANYETWMDINMNYSEENNPIALKTTVSNRELKSMVEFYKKDLVPKYDIPELWIRRAANAAPYI